MRRRRGTELLILDHELHALRCETRAGGKQWFAVKLSVETVGGKHRATERQVETRNGYALQHNAGGRGSGVSVVNILTNKR